MSEYLLPGKTAVIIAVDEDWQVPIDSRMEALGGHVFWRNRIEVEDAYYQRRIAAYHDELIALRLNARRIESLQQQLNTARDERKQRLEKRLAEIRAEHHERTDKLHQAWELTKSALR